MNSIKKFTLSASIALAMALTFGCAGEDEDQRCGFAAYNSDTDKCCGFGHIVGKNESCDNSGSGSTSNNGSGSTLCSGIAWNHATQFCVSGNIYDKCSGKTYSPSNEHCENGVLLDKCGGKEYNHATHFCNPSQNGLVEVIYPLCNSEKYNVDNAKCENNVLQLQCGSVWYDASSKYCLNGSVENKGIITDTRDKKTYKTVVIGTQTWMAENLNYAVGGKCGSVLSGSGTLSDANTVTCDTYGRLYDWITAMNLSSGCSSSSCAEQVQEKHKGICPSDWHIPSVEEWMTLVDIYIGRYRSSKALKAASDWNYYARIGNGEDTYGFSALPGGYVDFSGNFPGVGKSGKWWSATEDYWSNDKSDDKNANNLYIYNDPASQASYEHTSKQSMLSIRCVKDD